ncbi:9260_t:CDS:2, partial [Gigaspora rosea]
YNISECESNNSEYGSNYESDTKTSITKLPIFQPSKVEEQISNTTYFTEQGSLGDIHLWNYFLPNYKAKEGISLLNAYTQEELADKLVIQVEQSEYKKFLVVDDISEVYGVPEIHECINRQRLLRAVIDIDASQEDMKAKGVKARDVFIRICCSFIRALGLPGQNFNLCLIGSAKKDRVKRIFQFSLDNRWNNLNDARVQPPTSSRYEQNRNESGEIFSDSSIAEKIQQKNKNNIPPPIICKVDGPKFSWPFLEMPAWAKYDSPLTATET